MPTVAQRWLAFEDDPYLRQEALLDSAMDAPRPSDEVILAVSYHPSLRALDRIALLSRVETIEDLKKLECDEVARIIGRPIPAERWQPEDLRERALGARDWLDRSGGRVLWIGDPAVPQRVREQFDPPAALFLRGAVAAVSAERAIAVVGTRRATRGAREAAFALASDLASMGIVCVSGLARGIDGDAHRGTVVARGEGVAVLGSGIDTIYPAQHRELAGELLDCGGAIVSEYPPGVPPARFRFPARNRIIAGLGVALLLVEAPGVSGALYSVSYALQQGKDVFVHAAGQLAAGSAHAIENGATVIADGRELTEAIWGVDGGCAATHQLPDRLEDRRLKRFGAAQQSQRLVRGWAALALQREHAAGAHSVRPPATDTMSVQRGRA